MLVLNCTTKKSKRSFGEMNKAKLLLLSAALIGSLTIPLQGTSFVNATSSELIDSAKGSETFRVYVESNNKSTKNNIKNQ